MICLFVSTEKWDLVSAVIRWVTLCDWSHVGFYDSETGLTFSAMSDGKGIAWRKVGKRQKMLLLECPHADEMLKLALKREGEKYGYLDIVGMLLHKNWKPNNADICDVLVFSVAAEYGTPLLNHTFIPIEHLYPAHILLSPLVKEIKCA